MGPGAKDVLAACPLHRSFCVAHVDVELLCECPTDKDFVCSLESSTQASFMRLTICLSAFVHLKGAVPLRVGAHRIMLWLAPPFRQNRQHDCTQRRLCKLFLQVQFWRRCLVKSDHAWRSRAGRCSQLDSHDAKFNTPRRTARVERSTGVKSLPYEKMSNHRAPDSAS